ncbi:MAG: Ig-like domain-containing protein [Cytophagales bacterium]
MKIRNLFLGITLASFLMFTSCTKKKSTTVSPTVADTTQVKEVTPNSSPSVTLITPSDGFVTNYDTDVYLSAKAKDLDGTAAKLEFYVDNVLVETLNSGTIDNSGYTTFTTFKKNLSIGSHQIKAVAYDNLNASSESSSIRITVQEVVF